MKIVITGCVLLALGTVLLTVSADLRLTQSGALISAVAYLCFLRAGLSGRSVWLLALLLVPVSFYLWLLSWGH